MAAKTALVLLAPGAEEMETVIVTDVLRRAKLDVTVAGVVSQEPVHCSRAVVLVPDVPLEQVTDQVFDVLVLPGGGGGSKTLCESATVGAVLKTHDVAGKHIAAVCAATTAIMAHGIQLGASVTSHPGVKEKLAEAYNYKEERVVIDNKLITSRGPGTCFEFALTIVRELLGAEAVKEIAGPMMLPDKMADSVLA
eukprot:TRINITY_DN5062_c0_g1_i2.p1 TRINITY_DN5062_c0_g1~~TRINITY_DN5062_c0_g1_i2.p1  ORF type:complete len:195 (+),score=51.62 TRINITY_DN5062_c0_g1_i2:28-612(+)